MNESTANCPLCRGGVKRPGTTTFTVDLGFGVVVMRNAPAQVCDLCGSDWIEDQVAEKLECVVELAREKHPVVEVVNWEDEVLAVS